jgi:Chaperone for flagella basal body P-ring formation
MRRFALVLMSGMLALAALPCPAEPVCRQAEVRVHVEVVAGELTLADLLAPGACPQLHRAAARVSLGAAPLAGSVRVLAGREVRRAIEGLGNREWDPTRDEDPRVPERVLIRLAGALKPCAEIARALAPAASAQNSAGEDWPREPELDCTAARSIRENSTLELWKTAWNARLQRREFTLRCVRREDCVPFLVWDREAKPPAGVAAAPPRNPLQTKASTIVPLVKPGQTATLTWEQAGIRIVLPVICLEAGGVGQFVQVRFPHAPRTLRAEVVGAGTVRARL